nr:DNA methyltransferase [Lysinibacter cavernae]
MVEYHRNPRKGDVSAIAESLRARGQYKPLVVNRGSVTGLRNEILAGNHTFRAAVSLGWESIEVVLVDVSADEAAQIVLTDNRIADLGGYDDAQLLDLLEAVSSLDGTGYAVADVDVLALEFRPPASLTDPDEVPDTPTAPVSVEGDIWHLGNHVLLVGDCTDRELVRAAAPGVPSVVWTDPPYGVSYTGKTDKALSIKNDGLADAENVTRGAISVIATLCSPGSPVYVAHSDVLRPALHDAMSEHGLMWRQTLVWVKPSFVLGHSDYQPRHEPIAEAVIEFEPVAYGFTGGGSGRLGRGGPNWHGDNRQSTVFEVAKPHRNAEHPTMKPVELIERMLRNSIAPGGLVFDPFGGSGSTMIAAHRLGLKSFLVELDPAYADVICQRWQEHSGVVPRRNGEAVSFV